MGKGLKRDIWVLAGCWATVLTASTLITSASPLAAVSIGINRSVAPFTIGSFLIGAALISAYSAQIFTALGRAKGFGFGCALGLAGGVLGAIAMEVKAAWLIFIACFLIGTSQGLGQFYRFAATEICDEDERAPAVALVLSGGILAAFAGPEAAVGAQSFPWLGLNARYSGCFLLVAVANLMNYALIACVRFAPVEALSEKETPTPLREIFGKPDSICAVSVATFAHTSMVMLMSPLTLAMKDDGFPFRLTSLALELHFFSMYAPGIVGTGYLIKHIGPYAASGLGFVVFAICAVILAISQQLWNFILGMVFNGIAWNICFTSGTVLLTACYEKKDALRVQGINDLVIFGVAGAGSLASGYAYTAIGWDGLVYIVCGLMGLAGVFLAGSYRAASRRADGPEGSKSGSLSFTISPMTGGCPAPAGMVEPWGKSVSSTSSRSAV